MILLQQQQKQPRKQREQPNNMTVVYQPTQKMLGENARSIEYELFKIQEKLDDLETRVTALGG